MNYEHVILSHYLYNEDYMRKAFPFLKEEYFQEKNSQLVYKLITNFINKYNARPTKEALYIDLGNYSGINEQLYLSSQELIGELNPELETDKDWLINTTEEFCKNSALHNAIRSGINILEGKDKTKLAGSLPQIFTDALGVSFDTKIGHDYTADYMDRYAFYNDTSIHIPFDIKELNELTKGGLLRKTLTCFMAPVGVAKTAVKCHLAASHVAMGYNVLYISMEMSEEKISERIDANLLDINIDQLYTLSKDVYEKKIKAMLSKTTGKLIIKEYPTGGAGSANFRYLLNELKHKKNFVPDVVYIDYLNICASSRIKMGVGINSYTYVKSIAEELRALAIEENVAIVTSTQVNRSGFADSDFDMDKTSECIEVNQKIELRDGTTKTIGEVSVGDQIVANDMYKTVMKVHHKKMKPCYKIRTKSGKEILVSEDHVFPSKDVFNSVDRKSIKTGLKIGDKLSTK